MEGMEGRGRGTAAAAAACRQPSPLPAALPERLPHRLRPSPPAAVSANQHRRRAVSHRWCAAGEALRSLALPAPGCSRSSTSNRAQTNGSGFTSSSSPLHCHAICPVEERPHHHHHPTSAVLKHATCSFKNKMLLK